MFSCGFYDAIDNDRVYSATEFGEMFDGLITDGIYATIGHAFAVVPGVGVQVKVRSGRAWFNKRWSVNTADLPIDLAVPDLLLPRIDAIILEVDTRVITRNNAIKVITGVPNVNPTKPVLTRSDGLYQYPLAWVRVDQNVENIAASKIENNIGKDPTPFVTGILKSISIDELWNQWEGQFDDWFKDIQAQLSGDVALNLQNQITALQNNKVNVSAKATTAEAQTQTNDTKWMTPLKTGQAILARKASSIVSTDTLNYVTPSLLMSYNDIIQPPFLLNLFANYKSYVITESGTFVPPSDMIGNQFLMVLVGGGGGGGGGGGASCASRTTGVVGGGGGGGGSGDILITTATLTESQIKNGFEVVIGAGGALGLAGTPGATTGAPNGANGKNGTMGGSTTVLGHSAAGGFSGKGGVGATGVNISTRASGGIGFVSGQDGGCLYDTNSNVVLSSNFSRNKLNGKDQVFRDISLHPYYFILKMRQMPLGFNIKQGGLELYIPDIFKKETSTALSPGIMPVPFIDNTTSGSWSGRYGYFSESPARYRGASTYPQNTAGFFSPMGIETDAQNCDASPSSMAGYPGGCGGGGFANSNYGAGGAGGAGGGRSSTAASGTPTLAISGKKGNAGMAWFIFQTRSST